MKGNEEVEEEEDECEGTEEVVSVNRIFQVPNIKGNLLNYQYVMLMLKMGVGFQKFIDISYFLGLKKPWRY